MRKLVLSVLLLVGGTYLLAQPIFQKTLRPALLSTSTTSRLTSHSIFALPQGKLMLVGNSNQSGNMSMIVSKTDKNLTMQQSIHNGLAGGELYTYRSKMGPDGMIVTAGYFKDLAGAPDHYLYVSKMNTEGTLVWEKTLLVPGASSALCTAYDVVVQPDTSIVICGMAGSPKVGVLVKLDQNGTTLWDRKYAGVADLWMSKLIRHSSGDLCVVGIDNGKVFLSRINNAGNTVWSMDYGNVYSSHLDCGLVETQDGQIAFTNTSTTFNIALGKVDFANGAVLWRNVLSGTSTSNAGNVVTQTSAGDFIVGGRGGSATPWNFSTLARFSSTGGFLSMRTFSAVVTGNIRNIVPHPDGTLIAMSDTTIIKFRSNLTTCSGAASAGSANPLSTTATTHTPTVSNANTSTATYQHVSSAGFWKVTTDCGGKCNTVDNLSAGISVNDMETCKGGTLSFQAAASNGLNPNWRLDGATVANASSVTFQFNAPGIHEMQLIVNDGGTCRDTATALVNVTNCGTFPEPKQIIRQRLSFSGAGNMKIVAGPPSGGVVLLKDGYPSNSGMNIVRMNAANTTQIWNRQFSTFVPFDIVRTQDYGYVAAGAANGTIFLVKVDSSGNFLWSNNYRPIGPAPTLLQGKDLVELSNGSLAIGGSTNTGPTGTGAGWGFVFTTNATGTLQWVKEFTTGSTVGYSNVQSLLQRPNGDLIFAGSAYTTAWGLMLGKMNPNTGAITNLQLLRTSVGNEQVKDAINTLDGKILLVCQNNSVANYSLSLLKLEDDFRVLWQRRPYFNTSSESNGIAMSPDSGFVLTITNNARMVKVDKNGGNIGVVNPSVTGFNVSSPYRDPNGNYFYAYNSTGGVLDLERTTGDIKFESCNSLVSGGNYVGLSISMAPFSFFATGNYTYEDPQAVTQAIENINFSTQCTKAVCATRANYLGPLEACVGASCTYVNQSLYGSTYVWKVNGVSVGTSTDLTYTFPAAGAYTLRLVATNASGCKDSLSRTVNVSTAITANAGNDVTIACGASTTLTGSGGTTYTWSPVTGLANPNSGSTVATPTSTTSYILTATTNYCSDQDTVVVTISGTAVSISAPDSICSGSSATLTASGATSYLWSPGGQTTASITVSPSSTTTYSVTGTSTGCSGTDSHVLHVKPTPSMPTAGSNSPVNLGGTLNLTATTVPGATYAWSGPNGFTSTLQNPTISGVTALQAGTYSVVATQNGCSSATSTTTVVVNITSTLSGTIRHPNNNDMIRFAGVAYTGPTNGNLITGTNGYYHFPSLTPGGNYTVTPSKANDSLTNNGITTLDLVLMQRHILNQDTLDSPYKIIAADVNNSSSVTTIDIVLTRTVILQTSTTFPSGRLWYMVNADHTFVNPLQPWPYPSSRNYPSVSTLPDQDYYGVKIGDVNWSWNPNISKTETVGSLPVYFGDPVAFTNGVTRIPVMTDDFREIAGYQFTIAWDPNAIEFVRTQAGSTMAFAGESNTANGQLTISWNHPEGAQMTLEDGSILFYLEYRNLGGASATSLHLNSSAIPAEAYNRDLDVLSIAPATKPLEVPSGVVTSFPNPFSGTTTFRFQLPVAGKVGLVVSDLSGRIVAHLGGDQDSGLNEIVWDGRNDHGQPVSAGTYLVTFNSAQHHQVIRITKI